MLEKHKKLFISLAIIAFLVVLGVGVVIFDKIFLPQNQQKTTPSLSPRPTSQTSSSPTNSTTPTGQTKDYSRTEVLAENLSVPWDIVFLPEGDILFTERAGKVKRLFLSSDQHVGDVFVAADVLQQGESGLHGIALHPDFANNKYVYLYYTFSANGNNTQNKVVRYTYDGGTFKNPTTVVNNIPGALFHDGGRIAFGKDGYLYITTGDAQDPSLAQNLNSLGGKVLRVTDTGSPAPGNPYKNSIYSYGHRNPQGITWDDNGNLWETEHGPSGTGSDCCRDEVNLIRPGQNYGWPEITGSETKPGMLAPIVQSGTSEVWAPAAIAYSNGSLYFAGLRGAALFQAKVNADNTISQVTAHLKNELGRIRAVTKGPDGMLYISTSNRDGRGAPKTGDDKIIRVNPNKL